MRRQPTTKRTTALPTTVTTISARNTEGDEHVVEEHGEEE
jgi:hypothetical protein